MMTAGAAAYWATCGHNSGNTAFGDASQNRCFSDSLCGCTARKQHNSRFGLLKISASEEKSQYTQTQTCGRTYDVKFSVECRAFD